jgi:hypothetical protein
VKAKIGTEFKHKNFYETLDEAQRRLLSTCVTYDGKPVNILSINNHKPDGIFRVYIMPCAIQKDRAVLPNFDYFPHGSAEQAAMLDQWMEANKSSGMERKKINSPLFNKFRPFPLGMINKKEGEELVNCYFLERTPERRTHQGLTTASIVNTKVELSSQKKKNSWGYRLYGGDFVDCVTASHPSAAETLENMMDPKNGNTAVAIHRNFAIIRGPLDTLFLGYKDEVVGFVPRSRSPEVELGTKFAHLRETLEETKQFADIRIRS